MRQGAGSTAIQPEDVQHQSAESASPALVEEEPRQQPNHRGRLKTEIKFSPALQNSRQRFARFFSEIVEHGRLVDA